jgi:hypothetical protein
MRLGFALLSLAAAALVQPAMPLAADPPVRTKVAFGDVYTPGGGFGAFNWTHIEVNVQNIAYEKNVTMHYKGSDGVWHDFPLPFMGHYGNYDVFGTHASTTPATDEFVVKYTVPGGEFWDNNNGANYHIATFVGAVGGNVMLKQATARIGMEAGGGFTFTTSWFEGEIYVRNLSFNKRVGLRYSADGGATWSDVDGTYAGKVPAVGGIVDNTEIWKVKTPTLNYQPAANQFRFAVFYELRDPGPNFGTQYWDNNFAQDYFLFKGDGTVIR